MPRERLARVIDEAVRELNQVRTGGTESPVVGQEILGGRVVQNPGAQDHQHERRYEGEPRPPLPDPQWKEHRRQRRKADDAERDRCSAITTGESGGETCRVSQNGPHIIEVEILLQAADLGHQGVHPEPAHKNTSQGDDFRGLELDRGGVRYRPLRERRFERGLPCRAVHFSFSSLRGRLTKSIVDRGHEKQ